MASQEKDEAEKLARRKRVRLLKKLIVIVPLAVILILLVLCIFLGIRLHIVKKELQSLQSIIEKTAVMQEKDSDVGIEETEQEPAPDNRADTEKTVPDYWKKPAVSETEPEENVRKVYLTFDDGPSSNTDRILDILASYDVKATFFVVGKENEEYQSLYNRIVEEGHTLAMHSYSHKYNEIYQSVETYAADLKKLQRFLHETTGVWSHYCRFPGGSSNTVSEVDMHDLISYLQEEGITYFDWNVSSGDAANSYISPEDIVQNCTGKLENYHEAIILMHDASNKNSTVEALPALIETIQAMENTRILPITDDTEPIQHISNDERMED